jgi:hypothetical protein
MVTIKKTTPALALPEHCIVSAMKIGQMRLRCRLVLQNSKNGEI